MDQLVASILFDVGTEFLIEPKVKEIKPKVNKLIEKMQPLRLLLKILKI